MTLDLASDEANATPAFHVVNDNGLCLSGGGFRATLFHLGAVQRMNELGVLPEVSVITSVSGGSILNGVLATRWRDLTLAPDGSYSNFQQVVANPVRAFCKRDLRTALLVGAKTESSESSDVRNSATFLRSPRTFLPMHTLRFSKISGLPTFPRPNTACGSTRFVFCSTSFQDRRVFVAVSRRLRRLAYGGFLYRIYGRRVRVCRDSRGGVVGLSTPGFAALTLSTSRLKPFSRLDPWGNERPESKKRKSPFKGKPKEVLLTDGGVYDNLGVEPLWDSEACLLVSDAGRPFFSEKTCRQTIGSRLGQISSGVAAEQVGAVRKRWLVQEFKRRARRGVIWSIGTPFENYGLKDACGYGADMRTLACDVRTDLNAFTDGEIGSLENHGYSLADAAIRSFDKAMVKNPTAKFIWPNNDLCTDSAASAALRCSGSRGLLRDICTPVLLQIIDSLNLLPSNNLSCQCNICGDALRRCPE